MAQKKHHQILEGLVHYGYLGIDAHTKVCYQMDGIKTSALDVPTGQHQGGGKPWHIKMTLFGLYLISYQPHLSFFESF
jgi:hypothetical protein